MGEQLTLDDLMRMNAADLEELYLAAATPALDELRGDYAGRVFVATLLPMRRSFSIKAANGPWLPWKGKVFLTATREGGTGANRIVAGPVRRHIWPFETSITPSRFGGKEALRIGYDLDGNPGWLRRRVTDELKRVNRDLYLGVGGLKLAGSRELIFYWGLCRA